MQDLLHVNTIKFIDMLNELAIMTKQGFKSFYDCPVGSDFCGIVYDEDHRDSDGGCRIVDFACLDSEVHHYDERWQSVTVKSYTRDTNEAYVRVAYNQNNLVVMISNGVWRVL